MEKLLTKTTEKSSFKSMIQTPCRVVYKVDNQFEVLRGIALERKEQIWGYELRANVFVKCICGPDIEVMDSQWDTVKAFADQMLLGDLKGHLPWEKTFNKFSPVEQKNMDDTAKILRNYGIAAQGNKGMCWCRDCSPGVASVFAIKQAMVVKCSRQQISPTDRIVVAFN